MDVDGSVFGLLLSYIDHGGLAMFSRVDSDEPSAPVRVKWVGQLDAAITALHKAGVVWEDVKSENVLVDHWQEHCRSALRGVVVPDFSCC